MAKSYYRCEPRRVPTNRKGLSIVVDPESGEVLIASTRKLVGFKKSDKESFDRVKALESKLIADSKAAAEKPEKPRSSAKTKAKESEAPAEPARVIHDDCQLERTWRIEPESTRETELCRVAIANRKAALRCRLGGGRGDSIVISRALILPEGTTRVSLGVQVMSDDDDSVALEAVLTTERQRPWLAAAPQQVDGTRHQEVEFDFGDAPADKRSKCNRLQILIRTDLDEGSLFISSALAVR